MAVSKSRPQQGIQSIEVGSRVLRALVRASRPQMLRDLAAAAEMAPAKAHRYLVSLTRMGLVEQTEAGLYDLGCFALELGLAALNRLEPVTLSAHALQELRADTGQTIALAVWANHGATIVRWLGADTPVSASLRVGAVMPLTRSATGQAFLTHLSPRTTTPFLKRELSQHRRQGLSPSTPTEVERLITRTRVRGFAYTTDFIPGIAGIAVPVFDHTGDMVLALVALGYRRPFESAVDRISAATLRKARELSKRMGASIE